MATYMTPTLYGIRNCDTVKKARRWLEDHAVQYQFHDYKAAGVDRKRLESWCEVLGWERLLNRSGTTFRKLTFEQKQDLDIRKAVSLMLAQPSLIKRPVLDCGDTLLLGFKDETYGRLFSQV